MTSREHRELAKTLEGFPAFAGCRADDLVALAKAGRLTSLPARWTFLHEGTPADAVYVLLSGQARVLHDGAQVAELGTGAVLGEMALIGRSLRNASVVTASPVRALRIDYDALSGVFRTHPRLETSLGAVYTEHSTAVAAEDPRATT